MRLPDEPPISVVIGFVKRRTLMPSFFASSVVNFASLRVTPTRAFCVSPVPAETMFVAVSAALTLRPSRSGLMCAFLPLVVNEALRGARSTFFAIGFSSGARPFGSIDSATSPPAGAAFSRGASCFGVSVPTRLPLKRSGIGSASSCSARSIAAFAASVEMAGWRCWTGTSTTSRPASPARPIRRRVAGVSNAAPAWPSTTRAVPSLLTTSSASLGSACRLASASGRKFALVISSGGSICVDHRWGSSRASMRPLE